MLTGQHQPACLLICCWQRLWPLLSMPGSMVSRKPLSGTCYCTTSSYAARPTGKCCLQTWLLFVSSVRTERKALGTCMHCCSAGGPSVAIAAATSQALLSCLSASAAVEPLSPHMLVLSCFPCPLSLLVCPVKKHRQVPLFANWSGALLYKVC